MSPSLDKIEIKSVREGEGLIPMQMVVEPSPHPRRTMRDDQSGASMRWMKRSGGPVHLGCAAVAACALSGAAAAQSLFDSGNVGFTELQATRGQAAYTESCAACHGPNLNDGQFAPAVKGAPFRAHWHDQSPEALLALLTKRMPPASPGSLGSRTYADIEAYLLRENGDKAGLVELAASGTPATSGRAEKNAAAAEHDSVPRTVGGNLIDNQDADYHAAIAAREILLNRLTPVSDTMLRSPPAADWLMWRGTYATLGYSRLDQINKSTVRNLGVAWTLALPPSANEAAPLVHDGVLFIEGGNTVEAINATDGSILWQYIRSLPDELHNGRDARMKGLAIYEDRLYALRPTGISSHWTSGPASCAGITLSSLLNREFIPASSTAPSSIFPAARCSFTAR